MTQQKQSGGSGSTNIQVASVHVGLGYEDVRAIARDVFEQNFATLAQQAEDVASKRAETIRDEIVDRLTAKGAGADSFSHVEKQVALLDAQRGYALSGDDELKQVLVDAVVGLSAETERSLKSIVLQESIKAVSSLTPEQLRLLAAIFVVKHVSFGNVSSLTSLFKEFDKHVDFSVGGLIASAGALRHLEYVGCGKTSLSSASLHSIVSLNYQGLISRGHSEEELSSAFAPESFPPGGVMRCLRDPARVQIAALNNRVLDEKSHGWSPHQKEIARQKLAENLIDEAAFEIEVRAISPEAEYLFEVWTSQNLNAFELTSVGIAIGHTYATARGFIADLSIWL